MKFNLMRLSLFALISLMSVSAIMATPICQASVLGTTPPPGTALPYENTDGSSNGYVCDFGGLEFSNFHSGPTITASQVGVQPGYAPPPAAAGADPGFEFNGPFSVAGSNQGLDISVGFTVTALTGLITDVHIQLDSSHVTGTGNVSYDETVCLSSTNCDLFVDNPTTGSLTTDLVLTTPSSSITITKDLALSSGANGTASMTDFSNYYSHSAVPEPRAVSALLGLGFFGIMAFVKRRQAVRS
jgi:hypothetical protein